MGENFTLDSAHNFGIYTKSGKRTIFQVDFSYRRISLIERGKINKTYNFEHIDQYDSEENLLIVIRFRNNKTLEFDADTAEEKYTICRLLGIILGNEQIDNVKDFYISTYKVGYGEGSHEVCLCLFSLTIDVEDQRNGIQQKLSTKKQVIRETVLEKRGNTKIPTWSRRRLQVCPGEFSYYKPGDEVALNLVQLWENSTSVSNHGNNGFTVSVRDRTYQFRVPHEKGFNQEVERDKWVQAFKQASQRKRATFLLLEMSKQTNYADRRGMPLPSLPSGEDDNSSYGRGTVTSTGSSSGSCQSSQDFLDELQAINELDDVINDASGDRRRDHNISLSVVQKESPVLNSPTKYRARPPALGNFVNSSKSVDSTESEPMYVDIPEPDYSPPSSPEHDGKQTFTTDLGNRPSQASGIYKTELGNRPFQGSGIYKTELGNTPSQSSGIYKTEIIPKSDSVMSRQDSGMYTKVIRAGSQQKSEDKKSGVGGAKPAGAVDVMPKFDEIPKLKKVGSVNKSDDRQRSPRDNNEQLSVKEIQANMENLYQNEQSGDYGKPVSPPGKSKFPPPAPSAPRKTTEAQPMYYNDDDKHHQPVYSNNIPQKGETQQTYSNDIQQTYANDFHQQTYANEIHQKENVTQPPQPHPHHKNIPAPPPPLQNIPAPPPILNGGGGKGKLKQVHWSRTPKPLIAKSIWERPCNMTSRLNVRRLEEQFSLKERDANTLPGPKNPTLGGKQLLIDGKRAQNLGIFMSGLKNGGTRKLIDVLNSVNEDDDFPAEKLTTIRRYQPTEDEIDMYLGYSHKRQELHPIDQFMLDLCEIPCLNIRIDICLTLWDFPWQYESTCQLVEQVHGACDELLSSPMLVRVLEYLLAIGNYLNRNWSEGNVTQGFQVSSLDKVLDVRGREGKYSIVNFLIEQLRLSDPGLLQWPETIQTVKKCEQVTVKAVAAEGDVLKGDLMKVKKHLKTLKSKISNPNRQDNKFQQDVQNLAVEYEMKLEKLDRRCAELNNKYRQVLVLFGEPLYQRADTLFAVFGRFYDKFKSAIKDSD